ncbi:MAG TPA: hypothetical protein VJN43_00515 [Bryobacteraceae bacterium]|nr:hypothetical protein [Bryobacteraceae bacterium]
MTIGIGVLCSTQPRPHSPRPDAIAMFSDTMGSTDTDSTDEVHKMYCYPSERLYAVCAGKMEIAGEIFGVIQETLRGLAGPRNHGTIWRSMNRVVHGHRSEHFAFDVVNPRYAMQPGGIPQYSSADIIREWQDYDVRAELLIGTFDDDGKALLYFVGRYYENSALVHAVAFPGYQAIGTGAVNADGWLNYRHQKLSLNIRQSALHAYEARMMASRAPTVNDTIEMVVATADTGFMLSADNPYPLGCPVSLPELESLSKEYGPRNTKDLGFPKVQASKATSS